ncbi:phospholipase A2 inhibitor NAI [Varanus komodoensis]|uniref:phospholipase A2 inhibitor NAI n=1 Tax=Varanus komodoensis TaxID=61221 RepID=UPI001CF7BE01|nr:phospholipase A2 inhibitor NAI [Varanus komodoensis]
MEHEGAHGNIFALQKSCVYNDDCDLGLIDLTYGEGQFMRENTFCCSGSPCVTPPLEFSAFRSKVQNGKICPGCSSLSSVCLDEVVHCKGADNYCFGFVTYKEDDTINSTTKGCTTKAVCAALNRYRGKILRGTELKDIACEPAKDVLVKVAPSSGFTFLALLLMNHLL